MASKTVVRNPLCMIYLVGDQSLDTHKFVGHKNQFTLLEEIQSREGKENHKNYIPKNIFNNFDRARSSINFECDAAAHNRKPRTFHFTRIFHLLMLHFQPSQQTASNEASRAKYFLCECQLLIVGKL